MTTRRRGAMGGARQGRRERPYRADMGGTEDAASRRPARPCGTVLRSETSSYAASTGWGATRSRGADASRSAETKPSTASVAPPRCTAKIRRFNGAAGLRTATSLRSSRSDSSDSSAAPTPSATRRWIARWSSLSATTRGSNPAARQARRVNGLHEDLGVEVIHGVSRRSARSTVGRAGRGMGLREQHADRVIEQGNALERFAERDRHEVVLPRHREVVFPRPHAVRS